MDDPFRAAVQAILDAAGDGWTLAHYVIPMGIERMSADGHVEHTFWLYNPPNQADYITEGLLAHAADLYYAPVEDE